MNAFNQSTGMPSVSSVPPLPPSPRAFDAVHALGVEKVQNRMHVSDVLESDSGRMVQMVISLLESREGGNWEPFARMQNPENPQDFLKDFVTRIIRQARSKAENSNELEGYVQHFFNVEYGRLANRNDGGNRAA